MPTPGNTPWGEAPGPFWESHKREPTPREAQGAVERPSVRGGMEPGSTRSRDRPLIDVDSLLPPSPAGARRSPRISPRVRPNSSVVWKILCPIPAVFRFSGSEEKLTKSVLTTGREVIESDTAV